jgi:cytochrome b6-f complex subunit 4
MSVIKKPDLSDKLRAKLAKWDTITTVNQRGQIFYIFPIVIFGTFACVIGLSVLEPDSENQQIRLQLH